MIIEEKNEWFTIEANPRTSHVRMALRGLWTDAITLTFKQALVAVVSKMIAAGAPFGTYRTLVDLRDQGILPKTVADLAMDLATGPGAASERIAVVVLNTLHKLQLTRVAAVDQLRVFQDQAEAEAWVFARD